MPSSPPSAPSQDASACTVYFDGACPLCRAEIGAYRRLDRTGAIAFVDVSQEGDPAADLSRREALARFHVRLPDGRLVSGGRAFAALWRRTPGLELLGRIAGSPPLIWLAEPAYWVSLRLRPGLQALARFALRLKGRSGGAG